MSDPNLEGRDLFAGTPYRALSRLGAGGMGEVYLVEHVELGRRFVAKLLLPALSHDAGLRDRLRIEAQALARLNHPNVVSVVNFGCAADGRPFFVMERLKGRSLGNELRARRALPLAEALLRARELLSALAAAHALGIVHRDLKPDNLFLHETDDDRVLKVLDFGVARVLPGVSRRAPAPLSTATSAGMVVGSPRYISPEGARGLSVDARADLYAAGLVLYRMLAGRGPFDHARGKELLLAHQNEVPAPPSTFAAAEVPPDVDRVVLRALAKDSSARFQSALEFDAALLACAPTPKARGVVSRRARVSRHEEVTAIAAPALPVPAVAAPALPPRAVPVPARAVLRPPKKAGSRASTPFLIAELYLSVASDAADRLRRAFARRRR